MTSQASAFTRLRRALDHESLLNADAAAREMPRVGLSEALELLVLIHAQDRKQVRKSGLTLARALRT